MSNSRAVSAGTVISSTAGGRSVKEEKKNRKQNVSVGWAYLPVLSSGDVQIGKLVPRLNVDSVHLKEPVELSDGFVYLSLRFQEGDLSTESDVIRVFATHRDGFRHPPRWISPPTEMDFVRFGGNFFWAFSGTK